MGEGEHARVVEVGETCRHGVESSLRDVEQTRHAFIRIVAAGSGRLNGTLDAAALHIAKAIDPTVDVDEQLARLDVLAEQVDGTDPASIALGLFGGAAHDPRVHFRGNADAYYDRDNSLLNCVLDRRVGIPISLAVLLIEVARRRDVRLHGVGMPGHFLVGSATGFIDPFHGGVMLDQSGCEQLFRTLAGADARLPAGSLTATPPALIIKRMLVNLSGIGTSQGERRTLHVARSLLAAFPDASHRDHIQHAYAAAAVGRYAEAADAGERVISMVPDAARPKVNAQVTAWRAQLN